MRTPRRFGCRRSLPPWGCPILEHRGCGQDDAAWQRRDGSCRIAVPAGGIRNCRRGGGRVGRVRSVGRRACRSNRVHLPPRRGRPACTRSRAGRWVPRRSAVARRRVHRRRRILRHLGLPHHRAARGRDPSQWPRALGELLRPPGPTAAADGFTGARCDSGRDVATRTAPRPRRGGGGRPRSRAVVRQLALRGRVDAVHVRGRSEPRAALLVTQRRGTVLRCLATAAARRRGPRAGHPQLAGRPTPDRLEPGSARRRIPPMLHLADADVGILGLLRPPYPGLGARGRRRTGVG